MADCKMSLGILVIIWKYEKYVIQNRTALKKYTLKSMI